MANSTGHIIVRAEIWESKNPNYPGLTGRAFVAIENPDARNAGEAYQRPIDVSLSKAAAEALQGAEMPCVAQIMTVPRSGNNKKTGEPYAYTEMTRVSDIRGLELAKPVRAAA